jgi:hypothetical protein
VTSAAQRSLYVPTQTPPPKDESFGLGTESRVGRVDLPPGSRPNPPTPEPEARMSAELFQMLRRLRRKPCRRRRDASSSARGRPRRRGRRAAPRSARASAPRLAPPRPEPDAATARAPAGARASPARALRRPSASPGRRRSASER